MRRAKSGAIAAALMVVAGMGAGPAMADPGFERAHSLRSLDIMLMVTALRCRSSADDFQEDYYHFSSVHRDTLRRAGAKLRAVFEAGSDGGNPDRLLDRMGVVIANSYGGGHPWLGCGELGEIVRDLAMVEDEDDLTRAARHLLGNEPEVETELKFGHPAKPDANVRITYSDTDLIEGY